MFLLSRCGIEIAVISETVHNSIAQSGAGTDTQLDEAYRRRHPIKPRAHARRVQTHCLGFGCWIRIRGGLGMRVVDLYCGGGGFSAGAMLAGCEVVLGVDCDPVALDAWRANTKAPAVLARLWDDSVPLPEPAPDLHLHMSPPCTHLSKAKQMRTELQLDVALDGVETCVQLAVDRGYASWSLENVSTPATVAALTDLANRMPDKVAFATLDASNYGCPSSRRRLIAGPPALVRRLLAMRRADTVSVREAFRARGLPLGSEFVKNASAYKGRPTVRSVDMPSHTQVASHSLTWCTSDGVSIRTFNSRETIAVMGFPDDWVMPAGKAQTVRAVGNAVPPPLSRCIMLAASG